MGSHLVDRLLEMGHAVTVLDNFTTGSERNLAEKRDHAALRIVRGTVLDADLVDTLVSQHPLTFHLAAAVGVKLIVLVCELNETAPFTALLTPVIVRLSLFGMDSSRSACQWNHQTE